MVSEILVAVEDKLTGERTYTRAMIDFGRVSHIQEDLNLNTLLINDFGEILFVSTNSYEEIVELFIKSRANK